MHGLFFGAPSMAHQKNHKHLLVVFNIKYEQTNKATLLVTRYL